MCMYLCSALLHTHKHAHANMWTYILVIIWEKYYHKIERDFFSKKLDDRDFIFYDLSVIIMKLELLS